MTEFETLKFAQSGAVVNIVLDRPEAANGMNDALTRDLAKAAALCDTAGVKVVMAFPPVTAARPWRCATRR